MRRELSQLIFEGKKQTESFKVSESSVIEGKPCFRRVLNPVEKEGQVRQKEEKD